jgi:hypothetical protein
LQWKEVLSEDDLRNRMRNAKTFVKRCLPSDGREPNNFEPEIHMMSVAVEGGVE